MSAKLEVSLGSHIFCGLKKVLYLVAPLFWASNLFLIWAPNSFYLVVSGVLLGFLSINLVITGAMTFERVPPEQMGRWMGMTRCNGR